MGQYRYALDLYSWEVPEGASAEREAPLAAARRELLEETGYTAGRWREIARVHLSNSISDEEAVCYLATDLRAGTAQPDATEQLQVRWIPFTDALALIAEGHITDALTILALQRVALLRLKAH